MEPAASTAGAGAGAGDRQRNDGADTDPGGSDPYPSEDDAVAARDFVLRVANSEYPIRFDGWEPPLRANGAGYVPPAAEDAALIVRVKRSPPSAPHVWRLEATRPDGYVMATTRPYPSYQAVDAALDFVGTLCVLAGDPAQTGRVITSTTPDDRVCNCRSLAAACLHFEIETPDERGPGRGLSLDF